MAHLTCTKHKRRVIFTDTAVIHRNGDGSRCDDHILKIGGFYITALACRRARISPSEVLQISREGNHKFVAAGEMLHGTMDRLVLASNRTQRVFKEMAEVLTEASHQKK